MSILILGAGAFGASLAQSFAAGGSEVTLWGRDASSIAQQNTTRQSARLSDVTFHSRVNLVSDLPGWDSDVVLLAVPLQTLRPVLSTFDFLAGKMLVACCKGIELTTGQGPVSIINDIHPDATCAILTGPSFAQDIATGLPTALTLACADDGKGRALQARLGAPNLRIYRTTDVVGAELGGALKNVIAIACGAAIGAGLGESARAALMTRGFAEMKRMARALGADPATLSGLSGFGDLSLTCSSLQSRNYQFGLALGRGERFDPNITVEGAATARATLERAATLGLDMPITQSVVGLLDQKLNLREAMELLLARPPKEE